MAIDSFLYFVGASKGAPAIDVKGESTDDAYKSKNAIEVFSWSLGAFNPVSIGSSSTGHGAGKVSFSELVVSKKVDLASPMFLLACSQGAHFPEVHLDIRKSGAGDGKPYLTFVLKEVMVSSINISASSEEGMETVTLAFGSLLKSYAPQLPTGKLGTPVPAGWDVMKNIKV